MVGRRIAAGRLLKTDPDAARVKVAAAITDSRGCLAAAAHRLDTKRRNLARWIHTLGLWPHVWEERRKAGNARWTPPATR